MKLPVTYDLAIIGTGRVGLPLGLSMCEAGIRAIGIERDIALAAKVNKKEMPFYETGCDELLAKVDFPIFTDISLITRCRDIVITVGTPLLGHIETDLSQINQLIGQICPYLTAEHNLILRSTVAPGTTEYVRKLIERETVLVVGKDIFLSFCPERIAEGRALSEIRSLPQIIGCSDEASFERARDIFDKLTDDIFKTDYVSAELVKLFNNISRYVHFAMANQCMIIAERLGVNIYDIQEMTNYKYPRGILALPGFTAGTCLRKDFGMLNEFNPYSDLMLAAWKINEFLPKFLLEAIRRKTTLSGKTIAVLGYSFKTDTDDTRDSLVPKLIRYIEREVPASIAVHDPFLPSRIDELYDNNPLEAIVPSADIIFIGTGHTAFKENFARILDLARPEAYFVDIWNVSQSRQITFQKCKDA
jgi:UDP-N-acetyl-D-mannosaminuronic acid dehydrogenase